MVEVLLNQIFTVEDLQHWPQNPCKLSVCDCVFGFQKTKASILPYILKFSLWINFHVFRELVCICENKNHENLCLRTRHGTYFRKLEPQKFHGASFLWFCEITFLWNCQRIRTVLPCTYQRCILCCSLLHVHLQAEVVETMAAITGHGPR